MSYEVDCLGKFTLLFSGDYVFCDSVCNDYFSRVRNFRGVLREGFGMTFSVLMCLILSVFTLLFYFDDAFDVVFMVLLGLGTAILSFLPIVVFLIVFSIFI